MYLGIVITKKKKKKSTTTQFPTMKKRIFSSYRKYARAQWCYSYNPCHSWQIYWVSHLFGSNIFEVGHYNKKHKASMVPSLLWVSRKNSFNSALNIPVRKEWNVKGESHLMDSHFLEQLARGLQLLCRRPN